MQPEFFNNCTRNSGDADNYSAKNSIAQYDIMYLHNLIDIAYQLGLQDRQSLDNSISGLIDVSKEESSDMAKQKKIRRPIMIDGEKRWICGDTEQEYAENLMKAMQGQTSIEQPKPIVKDKHIFREYAQRWFEVFSKPNVSQTCAITYERQLRLHINPQIGDLNIEDITSAHVQEIFNSMGSDKVKGTKDKTKMVLNMIFELAIEEDIIVKNPLHSRSVRIKGRMSQPTRVYSIEQMQYIVSNIDKVKNPRDRAWLALAALHPLSPEEVLGLQGSDIDDEHIYVRRAVTHPDRNQAVIRDTKEEIRMRRIDLAQQIKKYLPEAKSDEFIIGGEKSKRGKRANDTQISSRLPMSASQVQRMCERIQRDIGFDEKITPQRFRTTVLTDLYDSTKDIKQVQEAAGHTTAQMTLKHYVKGRHQDRNTAIPVATAYGLAN